MLNYSELTEQQKKEINSIKKKIYDKLSYTNQSYEEILLDIISLFNGNNRLNTPWNNISESDIMFIFMSILAAHKDILNYMLDYRVLESHMNTAREVQSIYRIAASFGFKVPSYKAAKETFELSKISAGTTVTLNKFSTFRDGSGTSWSYLGDLSDESYDISVSDQVELFHKVDMYQGIVYSINNISPDNFNNRSKSHIINNKSIAIGNNYNNIGCSFMYATNGNDIINFKEVENVYTYNNYIDSDTAEGDDTYVYELNVDPQGITYIKLPTNIDLDSFGGYKFFFKYLVTSGYSITFSDDIIYEGSTFSPVSGRFVRGSNPPSKDVLKELFKVYYNTNDTLVTLDDYKKYILNRQKFILGVEKCLVADKQYDTSGGTGDSSAPVLNVGVYILKEGNDELDSGDDVDGLLEDLQNRSVSGINIFINKTNFINETNTEVSPLTAIDVTVELDGTVTEAIKDIVINYVNSIGIGEELTTKGISDILSYNGYNFYEKVIIKVDVGGTPTEVPGGVLDLLFNQYASIDSSLVIEKA